MRKNIKRTVTILLAAALLLAVLPRTALSAHAEEPVYSGTCGENLTWSFDPDTGTLTIEGNGDMADCEYNGAPWYEHRSAITAVSLPDGLTSIGENAFRDCHSLTSVTIPDSVTSIGSSAFSTCSGLTEITIPGSVKCIGRSAFFGCNSLTDVTIPDNVTRIDGYTFYGCRSLTSVTIPDSVTSIGEYAFWRCSSLTSVTIPGSVTSVGKYAFCDCIALAAVTIQTGVTSIGRDAFASCFSLTSVTIPDSVTEIGEETFYECTSLTSVTIPDSVTSIGDSAFSSCAGLTSVTIPNSVTSIGGSAFGFCTGLTSVTIPNSVTSIGEYGFCNCTSLTSVTIPDSVTSIGFYAFLGCTSLKSVSIGNNVTSIGESAFFNCTSLTSVTIPKNVTSIEPYAFGWNSSSEEYQKTNGFIIYGWIGTAAQTYAENDGFTFISLDEAVGGFIDVKPSAYYADAVLWAVGNKITSGTGNGLFSPKKTCTREQIVTFLWKACGSPEPESMEVTFSDVKPGKYYVKPILWAVENKITGGVGGGKFGVGKACTREQAMTFLWKACGSPEPETTENPFTDVKDGKYYVKPILWAVENKITGGTGGGKFGVGKTCTRAQIVTFLYKAVDFLPE